jgi:hypothetical protein
MDRRSAHGVAVTASCLCFERPSLGIPLSAVTPIPALSQVARDRKPVRKGGEAGGRDPVGYEGRGQKLTVCLMMLVIYKRFGA